MAYENFIPTLWSNEIQTKLLKELVYGGLANRNYEGQISGGGDTVKINQIGSPSVSTYERDTDITFEQLTNSQKQLVIDQLKYFAFTMDDVDKTQALMGQGVIDTGQALGAYELADVMDQYIASMYDQAGLTGLGTLASPTAVNSANVVDQFTLAAKIMDKGNVRGNRVAVIPAWLAEKLTLAEVGVLTDNRESYVNGYLRTVSGFQLFQSNNVSEASDETNSKVMFMVESVTTTLAQQIVKIVPGSIEKQFGEYVKGLHVYGAKVVRPDTLLTGYLSAAAEA